MKIQLTANNAYETAVLKYLEENASDALVEKINSGNKTLEQCFAYIREQARNEAQSGCAMIEDKVVYGWAIHFFEEDEIKVKEKGKTKPIPEPKEIVKKTETKKKPTKTVEKNEEQLSLFALLG